MTSLLLNMDSRLPGNDSKWGYWPGLRLFFGACLLCLMFHAGAMSFAQSDDEAAPMETTPEPARVTALKFDPEKPETGSRLKAYIKMAGAVRAEVRWSLNGEEVALADFDGLSERVDFNVPIKAGDKIEVAVTPFDLAQGSGTTATMEVVCSNAAPNLKLVKQEMVGHNYTAHVAAKDPENGPVALSIEGPPGMRIDQKGNVSWNIGTQTSGQFQVKVSAKDREGAQAILSYSIQIGRSRR